MKEIFPQYLVSAEEDNKNIWKNALFVFDTNVLLNFYRYQSGTREELLNVLERLSERIWIPHHVALEFQRNRLKVIATQNKRFSEVRKIVENAQASLCGGLDKMQLRDRHSLINPRPLVEGLEKLVDDFLASLEILQEKQQKIPGPDPLKERIEELFEGRVGPAPQDEDELEAIYKQAEQRFKLKIPPGYKDSNKDQDEPDEYISGGLIYKRKYGDCLIWMQILAHAEASKAQSVIFVTDDGKEDWWWKIDSEGPKTIGPRPELIEEAIIKASVQSFKMYAPEGFLKFAKEFFAAQVSEETLNEVRDISVLGARHDFSVDEHKVLRFGVEESVKAWLESEFGYVYRDKFGYPDFVIERDSKLIGIQVKMVDHGRISRNSAHDIIGRLKKSLDKSNLDEIVIMLIVRNLKEMDMLRKTINRKFNSMSDYQMSIITALFERSEDGRQDLTVFGEI